MASAAVWAERVSAWRASGLTADEFAEGRGFAGASLRWWSSRLRQTARPEAGIRLTRVTRVARVEGPVSSPPILIEVGAARIAVPRGVDRATLESVLMALGVRS